MNKFDLIIIGGGAGAFAAAIRANELKVKTAIINAGLPLGGTCVNVGCVPSKTLLWAGEILHHTKHHHIPGLELEIKNFDFQKVVQDELALVEKLRQEKYEKVLKNLAHVTLIEGQAKFVSKNIVEISSDRNPEPQRIQGEKFIIATGSTANVPPIEGIGEVGFITHIEALRLEKQPKELAVIGAGPLGLEFSQMYERFGTKVTVLERGSTIFGGSEPELTERLTEILTKEGITIQTNAQVKSVKSRHGKKHVSYEINGRQGQVVVDEILLAAGKTANTASLGLDKVRVTVDQRQAIMVNEFLQTSVSHILAVGDVTNLPLRLEITAGREGTLAASNALTDARLGIDYQTVPYTIFTDPQLAGVGYTDAAATEAGLACSCRTVSFDKVPKAIIMHQTDGLIKMVIEQKTKQIVGVHLLAPVAGELIAEAMILVKNKNTIDDVANSLPMFPTLSEAIKIVALSFTKDISKLSCCI